MHNIVSFLIAGANQTKVRAVLWAICFALLLGGGALFVSRELEASMNAEAAELLETYTRTRRAVLNTLDVMDRQLTARPCSAEYAGQQRRVAFLPDGMNELLYVESGKIVCTSNSGLLPEPIDLGEPDIAPGNPFGVGLWLNRDLTKLGLPGLDGLVGTIAVRGPNGMVVPRTPVTPAISKWLQLELGLRDVDGQWWHLSGEPKLYALSLTEPNGPFGLRNGAMVTRVCDPGGFHCLVARASLEKLMSAGGAVMGLTIMVSGIIAAWLSGKIYGLVAAYWSFKSRFLRRFQSHGVTCVYQPLLDLQEDLVTGCEVLARWRDVDGTMIYPDRFIPLVEQNGLTEAFTRLIVNRAHEDLLPIVPAGRRLQVNFNIFPQDLRADLLVSVFEPFLRPNSPFDLVIEIVETGEIDLGAAPAEIDQLRAAGARVYIDDFGSGYSSMHTLAGLSVDGVKLDRSFAMAPDGSVMARMLDHAIEMVEDSGCKIVVEGIETAARLSALKAGGRVDFAQGYYVSRPLECEAFARFLADRGPRPSARPRLVA